MHQTIIVTAPEIEPVSLSEAKVQLNFSGSSKDTQISLLITAARVAIEGYLNRALITQVWKVFYDCWEMEMKIPFPPLISVDSVKYNQDPDGSQKTLTESDYYWIVKTQDPGKIRKKYNAVFPILQYGRPNAIEIQFTCGYGPAATDVPAPIRQAILVMITDYFENKGDIVIGPQTVNKIPGHVADLIHRFRIYQF